MRKIKYLLRFDSLMRKTLDMGNDKMRAKNNNSTSQDDLDILGESDVDSE